jgi:hypothetical protein
MRNAFQESPIGHRPAFAKQISKGRLCPAPADAGIEIGNVGKPGSAGVRLLECHSFDDCHCTTGNAEAAGTNVFNLT